MRTDDWTAEQRAEGAGILAQLLAGVGDAERERAFRMCLTVCQHRGLTEAEEAGLSAAWHRAPPVDLAGGPVEVLWTKGIPDVPSVRPCEAPRKGLLPGDATGRIWVPEDCGTCAPCQARRICRTRALIRAQLASR
jgi:hypothetical protein